MTVQQKTKLLRDAHITVRVLEGEKTMMVADDLRCSSQGVELIVHRTIGRIFGDVVPANVTQRLKWLRRNKDLFLPRLRAATGE